MNNSAASILCVGMGWFPTQSGGLNRYVYELTHQLADQHDHIELCAARLPPNSPDSPVQLTKLATPQKLAATTMADPSAVLSTPWALESKQERESIGSIYFKRWLEQQVYRRCARFVVRSKALGKDLAQNLIASLENRSTSFPLA